MVTTKKNRDKIAVALGASLDWYDFALYGFFATTFSKIFFPSYLNKQYALFFTFTIWFISFVARPLGALIFGYIVADAKL